MSTEKVSFQPWSIRYHHYDPADEGRREALFALGNGYLLSRAAAPEAVEDDMHYPGTYRVGCYNRLSTLIKGKEVENESLVNLPNWLQLCFRINEEDWFSIDKAEILSYRQELYMDKAFLERSIRFRTTGGRITSLYEKRFVSMAQQHLMLLQQEIKAENWSGTLEVRSGLDGRVQNNNVERYAPFNKRHIQTKNVSRAGRECLALNCRTVQSEVDISLLARTCLYKQGQAVSCHRETHTEDDCISEILHISLQEGESLTIEKTVALFTSLDPALSNCFEAAEKALEKATGFDALFEAHCAAWKKLWKQCKFKMSPAEQLPFFRLHMFQILQNISPHTADLDVGVPPSGWQGEEYHGQIFWDEMFIFPFLTYRFPTIARSLLLYRYRRLDAARALAKESGFKGAMYPWRSASSGREETPLLQYNLYSDHWMEDYTYLQHHIGGIIAYSICNYVEVTGDMLFLAEHGAEMLVEIARFWASLGQYNSQLNRYEIRGVVGPDEHHTHYPGANTENPDERGIHNNTYTNVLAAWSLLQAGRMYQKLSDQQQQALQETIGLKMEELEQWKDISGNMQLAFLEDGTLDQFEGFHQLEDFDLDAFQKEHGDKRVDWTLEAEGDDVVRYKLSKQADTSLLLYLFNPAELQKLLQHMGHDPSLEELKKTIDHQIACTANESSLSRIVHAGALSHFDRAASWKFFREAQFIDLSPEEDEGTAEGIHLGAMGGTLGVMQHHYFGIEVQEDALMVNPDLPDEIDYIIIGLLFQGVELECALNHQELKLRSVNKAASAITIGHNKQTRTLKGGEILCFNLSK